MRIDIYHHIHITDPSLERKVDHIISVLETFRREAMKELDDLVAEVTDLETVEQGNELLLTNLSAQIAALKTNQTDPATAAAIAALVGKVDAVKTRMSAAIVANTAAA